MKIKFLPSSLITVFMATGCSSSGEYDYEDFPEWQACIDKYIEDMAGYYKNNNDLFDDAIERCKQLTPKKK